MGHSVLIALLVFAVPGIIEAHAEQKYVIRLDSPVPAAFVEVELAGQRSEPGVTHRFGPWEVTVAYDPANCTISCRYRKTGHGETVLPPVATVRVYSGDAARPRTVVVDPGGLSGSGIRTSRDSGGARSFTHERNLPAARQPAALAGMAARLTPVRLPHPPTPVVHRLPLRI